jgi:hypothetical protein
MKESVSELLCTDSTALVPTDGGSVDTFENETHGRYWTTLQTEYKFILKYIIQRNRQQTLEVPT